jgi:hypothetical protein
VSDGYTTNSATSSLPKEVVMRRLRSFLVIVFIVSFGVSAFAEEKKASKAKSPEWLTEWAYPDTKPDWKGVGQKLFNTVMVTTDDVEKVFRFYERKLCVVDKKVKSADGKSSASMGAAAGITLPGGHAVVHASINEEIARKLGIKPDFAHIFFGARDDSLLPANKGEKPKLRATVVRTLFQDTGDFNIHVVVSRGKDEKHTHVIVTYLRKPGLSGETPKSRLGHHLTPAPR